jgi:hypothetical protein
LTDAELKKTEPLVEKIKAPQRSKGKELSGLQLIAYFLRLRIQPRQARVSQMWSYSGSSDGTRVSQEDVSEEEVKMMARLLTTLTTSNDVPITCLRRCIQQGSPDSPGNRCLRVFFNYSSIFFFLFLIGFSGPSFSFVATTSSRGQRGC